MRRELPPASSGDLLDTLLRRSRASARRFTFRPGATRRLQPRDFRFQGRSTGAAAVRFAPPLHFTPCRTRSPPPSGDGPHSHSRAPGDGSPGPRVFRLLGRLVAGAAGRRSARRSRPGSCPSRPPMWRMWASATPEHGSGRCRRSRTRRGAEVAGVAPAPSDVDVPFRPAWARSTKPSRRGRPPSWPWRPRSSRAGPGRSRPRSWSWCPGIASSPCGSRWIITLKSTCRSASGAGIDCPSPPPRCCGRWRTAPGCPAGCRRAG